MNNGLVAIVDSEEAYAVKLADFFKAKSGLGYNVFIFTNIKAYIEFTRGNYIDILLISHIFGDVLSELSQTGQIFILSEGLVDTKLKEFISIYKYQPADNIIREIMTNYSASPSKTSVTLSTAGCSKIYTVYSPVKRCGKTTFSLVTGCLLARECSTLYITLEEYSAISFYTGMSCDGDLSDLLYFYRQNPDNLDKKLMALSHSLQKMDYIPPIRFSSDLKCVGGDEWASLLHSVASLGIYKNIILDLSDSSVDIYPLFDLSDIVYFPVLEDPISMEKIKCFKNVIRLLGKDELFEKIKEIHLPPFDASGFPRQTFELSDSDNGKSASASFYSLLYGTYSINVWNIIKAYEQ